MKQLGGQGHSGIADRAFDAAGGDPLRALLLVLELVWAGRLRATRRGVQIVQERIAA